jgi:hypothetical protein
MLDFLLIRSTEAIVGAVKYEDDLGSTYDKKSFYD